MVSVNLFVLYARALNLVIFICFSTVITNGYAHPEYRPCNDTRSIDITNGVIQGDGSIRYEGITYNTSQFYVDGNVTRGCICAVKGQCFRKCCKLGQVFVGKRTCMDTSDGSLRKFKEPVFDALTRTNFVATEYFGVLFDVPRISSASDFLARLLSEDEINPEFYLHKNGSLLSEAGKEYFLDDYCLETFSSDPKNESLSWVPRVGAIVRETPLEKSPHDHYQWYAKGQLTSVPFLLATMLVYLLVPGLRNLHGMVLIAYLTSLIVAYTFLPLLQLLHNSSWPDSKCLTFFFIIYYSFMASFFWLNVMCFDIWWTFCGFGGLRDSKLYGKWRRFLWYSCYAWGSSLALTGIVAFMQFSRSISNKYYIKPRVLHRQCWFHDNTSQAMYMHLPILILLIVNTIFFAVTAYKIVQDKRSTNMLKSQDSSRHQRFEKDRYRLNLYVKLFLVMGINWAMEVISFFVGGPLKYWYVTDVCNILVGVFIFLLFVCKKKIYRLIMNKLKIQRTGIESTTTATSVSTRSRREINGDSDRKITENIEMKDNNKPATIPADTKEHIDI